jgi:hypothetical protein
VVQPVERTSSVSRASTSAELRPAELSRALLHATPMLSLICAAASAAKGEVMLMESAMLKDSCEKTICREAVRGRPLWLVQAVGEPSSGSGSS